MVTIQTYFVAKKDEGRIKECFRKQRVKRLEKGIDFTLYKGFDKEKLSYEIILVQPISINMSLRYKFQITLASIWCVYTLQKCNDFSVPMPKFGIQFMSKKIEITNSKSLRIKHWVCSIVCIRNFVG